MRCGLGLKEGGKAETELTVPGRATTFSMSVDAVLCRYTARAGTDGSIQSNLPEMHPEVCWGTRSSALCSCSKDFGGRSFQERPRALSSFGDSTNFIYT